MRLAPAVLLRIRIITEKKDIHFGLFCDTEKLKFTEQHMKADTSYALF